MRVGRCRLRDYAPNQAGDHLSDRHQSYLTEDLVLIENNFFQFTLADQIKNKQATTAEKHIELFSRY